MPTKEPRLVVVMDEATRQQLDELARAEERTASAMVRVLIHRAYAAEHGVTQATANNTIYGKRDA